MNWFSLVIAVVGLAREFLKYKTKQGKVGREAVAEVKQFRAELRAARKTKAPNTENLENAFWQAINQKKGTGK